MVIFPFARSSQRLWRMIDWSSYWAFHLFKIIFSYDVDIDVSGTSYESDDFSQHHENGTGQFHAALRPPQHFEAPSTTVLRPALPHQQFLLPEDMESVHFQPAVRASAAVVATTQQATNPNQSSRVNPLTKEQLLQSIDWLMHNDADFVTKLHEGYVNSLKASLKLWLIDWSGTYRLVNDGLIDWLRLHIISLQSFWEQERSELSEAVDYSVMRLKFPIIYWFRERKKETWDAWYFSCLFFVPIRSFWISKTGRSPPPLTLCFSFYF